MKHCCDDKARALRALRNRQRRMLLAVLCINFGMFVVEAGAGLASRSSALLADSLDMFGDAVAYGVTLYVLDRGTGWQAWSSILKGLVMLVCAGSVVAEAAYKAIAHLVPEASTMGGVGILALVANGCCLLLLLGHRRDDINMTSAWICSRNDMIANLSVDSGRGRGGVHAVDVARHCRGRGGRYIGPELRGGHPAGRIWRFARQPAVARSRTLVGR